MFIFIVIEAKTKSLTLLPYADIAFLLLLISIVTTLYAKEIVTMFNSGKSFQAIIRII